MKRHMPSTNVKWRRKMVELYYYSQQTNKQGLHPSKQETCDENLTAAVPDEGLFIERKLVKFTLMSKVLKFLFGF